MKKLREVVWGIIGVGDVCEVKSAPAMWQLPNSRVKMVMRRDRDKAEDYARRHAIEYWTDNADELLSDPEINAIYIATPPDTHAFYTIKAANAGKAVYVEKPMANSYVDCQAMMDACQKADVPLFVAYYRRSLPGFQKVKTLIQTGEIGVVRFVKVEMYQPLQPGIITHQENHWRVNPKVAGGGYFNDLASHQLDYLDFLFGKITLANGFTANQAEIYAADDIVTATFQFESGVMGAGIWCFAANEASQKECVTIVGSEGEISFNVFGDPMLIQVRKPNNVIEDFEYSHKNPIQKDFIREMISELRGEGKALSDGLSGARTTWVMDQILKKQ